MAEVKSEKKEKVFVPPARGKEDPCMTVIVNGKVTRIPKGTEHEMSEAVALELKRSWKAERSYEETRRAKREEAIKGKEARR